MKVVKNLLGKDSQQTCETLAQQYRVLLEVSESIAAHRDLREPLATIVHL